MMNRDLLKEAIADAKAVKETAIANAKAALEEAFAPHLRSMLAAKLEEMDRDEEEDVEESMKSEEVEDMMEIEGMDEAEDEIEEEFDLNEILMELEKDEMTEAEDEEMEVEDTEMEADEEAEGEMEEEEIDLEDMSEDDLKSFIEDVIADMVAAGELEAGEELESEMGEEEIEVEDDAEEMMESDLEEMDDVSWKVKNGTSLNPAPYKVGQSTVNEVEDVEEVTSTSGGYDPSSGAAAGLENLIDSVKAMIAKGGPAAKKAYAVLQQLGAGAAMGMREGEDEMDEIEELKKELQEVNLLNAKLLYTNKIFKEKTLNESQKIKVLKAFDKAGSVKETKLIFETLSEGIAVKSVKSSMMNEIRSSASKTTGIIKENRQPIVEVDPIVARWQKLAGINKS